MREEPTALSHNEQILSTWKEIAAYLNCGVRTVQRWEAELKLPVRRPRGKARSGVIAFRTELDEWLTRAPLRLCQIESPGPRDFSALPAKVMVVEGSVRELNTCVRALRAMGVAEVDVVSNVLVARLRLEEMAAGKAPKPDIIILDLALPLENGLEILNYWKSTTTLKSISVVVWAAMDHIQRQLATTAGIHRVAPKPATATELKQALRDAATA